MRLGIAAVLLAVTTAGCIPVEGQPGWKRAGLSVEGRPLRMRVLGHGQSVTVIFGAFHGDEPESAVIAAKFASHLQKNRELLRGRTVVIIPEVNPDGLAAGKRVNANGVDLNRNLAAINWASSNVQSRYHGGGLPISEPEARVVVRIMEKYKPDVVVSIHSISPKKRCVNYDGPGRKLAESMSRLCGYPAKPAIGYPTPGSFGSFAGRELGIATITLELPRGADVDELWETCREALVESVRWRPAFPSRVDG